MALSFYNSIPTPELTINEKIMNHTFGTNISEELDLKRKRIIKNLSNILEDMKNEIISGQDDGNGSIGTLITKLSDLKKVNAEIEIVRRLNASEKPKEQS